jgi:hypothetical protein
MNLARLFFDTKYAFRIKVTYQTVQKVVEVSVEILEDPLN